MTTSTRAGARLWKTGIAHRESGARGPGLWTALRVMGTTPRPQPLPFTTVVHHEMRR